MQHCGGPTSSPRAGSMDQIGRIENVQGSTELTLGKVYLRCEIPQLARVLGSPLYGLGPISQNQIISRLNHAMLGKRWRHNSANAQGKKEEGPITAPLN